MVDDMGSQINGMDIDKKQDVINLEEHVSILEKNLEYYEQLCEDQEHQIDEQNDIIDELKKKVADQERQMRKKRDIADQENQPPLGRNNGQIQISASSSSKRQKVDDIQSAAAQG